MKIKRQVKLFWGHNDNNAQMGVKSPSGNLNDSFSKDQIHSRSAGKKKQTDRIALDHIQTFLERHVCLFNGCIFTQISICFVTDTDWYYRAKINKNKLRPANRILSVLFLLSPSSFFLIHTHIHSVLLLNFHILTQVPSILLFSFAYPIQGCWSRPQLP